MTTLDLDKVNKYCDKHKVTNIEINSEYLTFEDDNTGEVFDIPTINFHSKIKVNYLAL